MQRAHSIYASEQLSLYELLLANIFHKSNQMEVTYHPDLNVGVLPKESLRNLDTTSFF